jgi:hypothetical protein
MFQSQYDLEDNAELTLQEQQKQTFGACCSGSGEPQFRGYSRENHQKQKCMEFVAYTGQYSL